MVFEWSVRVEVGERSRVSEFEWKCMKGVELCAACSVKPYYYRKEHAVLMIVQL